MKKKQQVLLSVMGWTHDDDEPSDSVRLLTTGIFSGSADSWRIDYTETQPDNESSQVALTMENGMVTMQRTGQFGTSMVFQQGRRYESTYSTPFGSMAMGVYPTHVSYQVKDGPAGEVSLTYQLDLQGQFAAMHELRIRFCPAGKA